MTQQPSEAAPEGTPVSVETFAYMQNILDHKRLVGEYLRKMVSALFTRAVEHDASKFSSAEFPHYATALPRFERVEYGSEEYIAICRSIKPALRHHVTTNRHHPEYFPNGVNDMTLIDVVEMVCDWIAASQRGGGGPLRLDLQRARFGIDDQLFDIICRTVEALTDQEVSVQEATDVAAEKPAW